MSATSIRLTPIEPAPKGLPFDVDLDDNRDILPPIEHVARVWDELDREDFSRLYARVEP